MHAVKDNKTLDPSNIQKLDIRGKVCPMTFVYTKLALEKMKVGDILEVLLDFPAAVDNVPASCERQNLGKVLDIKTLENKKKEWALKIQRL
ncbi:hypothetical protein LCGC14_0707340 [marine sediment metagenome]|uniref:UPF0033 domain-containing protein n=1 Tax=marine sediment metagenome TaxID=412755 RepID=A0A0F9QKQ6_9ZZZZ|nr:MAG: hypothetical protein Lokiarch_10690 [Candidatus Lokiarchaeum sp. GC14_75]HEA70811.1 sulfurtransferase TusA family protein [archaeon]